MLLTFEALDADQGDCLLLHHGTAEAPMHIVIDGGPGPTFGGRLKPRLNDLRALRGLEEDASLPLELVVLTHTDADHIDGLLAMLKEMRDRPKSAPLPFRIDGLWFNGFDDVPKNKEVASIQALSGSSEPTARAMVASIDAGRTLRDITKKLVIPVNKGLGKLAMRPEDEVSSVDFGDDLTISLLSPTRKELTRFEAEWDKAVKAAAKKKGDGGAAAAHRSVTVPNIASIVLLAETDEHDLLLTGDARAEEILAGLEAAGRFEDGQRCEVDVFKIPHHGSCNNATPELFERVWARHYVVCANGSDGNPDRETLDMLWNARGKGAWRLWTTFTRDAFKAVTPSNQKEKKRREALEEVQAWLDERPIKVTYRSPKKRGVQIHLGDEKLD